MWSVQGVQYMKYWIHPASAKLSSAWRGKVEHAPCIELHSLALSRPLLAYRSRIHVGNSRLVIDSLWQRSRRSVHRGDIASQTLNNSIRQQLQQRPVWVDILFLWNRDVGPFKSTVHRATIFMRGHLSSELAYVLFNRATTSSILPRNSLCLSNRISVLEIR